MEMENNNIIMKRLSLLFFLLILTLSFTIADDLDCWFDPVYQEPEGVRDVWCNLTNTSGDPILGANISHSTYDTNDWYKDGLMAEKGWFLGYQSIPEAYNTSKTEFEVYETTLIDSVKRGHLEFGPFTFPFPHVKQEVSVLLQAGSGASTLRVMICNDTYTNDIMGHTPVFLPRTSLYPGCVYAGEVNATTAGINYNNWTWGTVDITDAYNLITENYTGLNSYSVHFSSYDNASISPVGLVLPPQMLPPIHNNTLEHYYLHNDTEAFGPINDTGYPNNKQVINTIDMSGNVLLFHLNESSGTVIDYSDNNNDGAYSGAGQESKGRFGVGYYFDGIDDSIIIQDDNTLDFTYVSVGLWINPDAVDNWKSLIHKKTDNDKGLYLEIYDGAIYNYDTIQTTGAVIDINKWSFITYTAGPIYERIYLNGELLIEEPTEFVGTDNGYELAIGKSLDYTDEEFSGLMDEVFLFNRELSSEEIYFMYIHGKNKFIPNNKTHNESTWLQDKQMLLMSDTVDLDATTGFPTFDSNDDVLIPQNISSWQSIGNTNSSFSLCYFLKRDDTSTDYRRLEKWNNPGGNGAMSFYINRDDITFWIRENIGAGCGYKRISTTGDVVGDTEWHHVCGIVDRENEEMRVIVDGETIKTLAITDTCEINEVTEVVIGRDTESSSSDNGFIGQLSNPLLHNDAHTAAEILNNINTAWWSLAIGEQITNDVYATGYLFNTTTYLWEDTPGHTPIAFTKIYDINNESAQMSYNTTEELYHYNYYTNKPELVTSQGLAGVNMTTVFETSSLNDTAYWHVAGSSDATCGVNLEWQYAGKEGQDALSHITWEINSTIGLNKRNLYLCEEGYTDLTDCEIYTGDSMSRHKKWDVYGTATVICEVQNDYMTEPYYANDTIDIGCWSAYDEYDGTNPALELESNLHVCAGTHTMISIDDDAVLKNSGAYTMFLEGPTTFDGGSVRGNHSTYNDFKTILWGYNLINKQQNPNGILTIQNGDIGFMFKGNLSDSYFANYKFINMSIAFDLEHSSASNFSLINNTFTRCGIGGEGAIYVSGENINIEYNTFNALVDDGDSYVSCEGCTNLSLEQNYYYGIENLEIYTNDVIRTMTTPIGDLSCVIGEYGDQYPYANYEIPGGVSYLNGAKLYGLIQDNYPCTLKLEPIDTTAHEACASISESVFSAMNLGSIGLLILITTILIGSVMAFGGAGFDVNSIKVMVISVVVISLMFIIGVMVIQMITGVVC